MKNLRNTVQLIGRLGANPAIKVFDNGNKMVKISLATSETYKDTHGEKISKTTWHQVIAWGKTAEIAEQYTTKGNEIAIEGKLTYRSYTDKDGIERFITEIVVNELLLLSGK